MWVPSSARRNLAIIVAFSCCQEFAQSNPIIWPQGPTSITKRLNGYISRGNGFYNGGKGVVVRNPFDGYEDDSKKKVVPATFIVDDIFSPNKVFPWFEKGMNFDACPIVYVVGSRMADLFYEFDKIQTSTWGWGVFYPWDSNAADSRCEYHWTTPSGSPQKWYDCPGAWKNWGDAHPTKDTSKLGAGSYPPGNPSANDKWGGGAGCHFSALPYGCNDASKCTNDIDQINRSPNNLVGDAQCQCNYVFNDNWEHWVDSMGSIASEAQRGTLPEAAMCWTNNLKDMINLQNNLFWRKSVWFREQNPGPAGYWGWNEIPVGRDQITNPQLWDAVVIKMPLYICGHGGGDDNFHCLSSSAAKLLETDLSHWVAKGKLVPGLNYISKRPGAYVVLMREWVDHSGNSFSWFFCQSWTSPNHHWKIGYVPMGHTAYPDGACWLEKGGKFTDAVLDQTFKPEVSRSAVKAHVRSHPSHPDALMDQRAAGTNTSSLMIV